MQELFSTNKSESLTPEEKFKAIATLKNRLEEDFVALGELLSEIKRMRTFKIKGYLNFKEFIETEYNMSNSLASKLIGIFDVYIKDLNMDSETVKDIGMDRLSLIKPLIKDAAYEVQEEWVKQAEELSHQDLKEKIKVIRDAEKESSRTLKDVLVEQYLDNMKGYFNCSGKDLNFKLALYFQDADLEKMNEEIREKQRKFEEEIQGEQSE
ncbi:MAG: hypothetical protein B6226_00935 [Candidatus Cloacimonetes bacterium 4572_65]|nr:MAG: hypothetical protein B6226_00935 [Candidatus Cloacimonetes bacterium 4572_65]